MQHNLKKYIDLIEKKRKKTDLNDNLKDWKNEKKIEIKVYQNL